MAQRCALCGLADVHALRARSDCRTPHLRRLRAPLGSTKTRSPWLPTSLLQTSITVRGTPVSPLLLFFRCVHPHLPHGTDTASVVASHVDDAAASESSPEASPSPPRHEQRRQLPVRDPPARASVTFVPTRLHPHPTTGPNLMSRLRLAAGVLANRRFADLARVTPG